MHIDKKRKTLLKLYEINYNSSRAELDIILTQPPQKCV